MRSNFTVRLSNLLFAVGIIMLLSAIVLLLNNVREDKQAKKASDEVLSELLVKIEENHDYEPINILGNDYCGIIFIQDLDIHLPIMASCSLHNLKISPCRYSGAPGSRNMVIAGHNYSNHFGKLTGIHPGTEVIFKDTSGNSFVYIVDCLEVLSPWQVDEMISGKWDLSLFTCTSSGRARLSVRCMLPEYTQESQSQTR